MTSVSTTFTNPVINADVPDMDVIRVGDNYYMMSTTMHLMPGAPVMTNPRDSRGEWLGSIPSPYP